MKKTFLFASLVLMPFLAFAQTVQTKTEKINDEATRTYSYYLNDKGEQVRHGKYTISWNVNKNDYKVKKRLDCNYKDGLLHGKLTYSCDWNVYKAYWSFTGSEDVVWKLENKMLDNFTVDMYEGYMTGDVNVTYQGWWTNETTFKCKAINGVLADDSELVVFERPRALVKEKLMYLNDGSEVKRYKNVMPAASPNANLQEPTYFIAFEFPSDQYGGTEKYFVNLPRYVEKPFDQLKDIEDYNFLVSYQGMNMSDIAGLDYKIRNTYYLSQASKDTLDAQYNLAKEKVTERKEAESRSAVQRKDNYLNAYENAVKINNQFSKRSCRLRGISNYYKADGYIYPVVTDANVENLLFAAYNKRSTEIAEILNTLKLSEYDSNGKIKVKGVPGTFNNKTTYEEITDETVKTMTDYVQKLEDEEVSASIKMLTMICEMENDLFEKVYSISKNYTKSTYSEGKIQAGSSRIPRFTNENCTLKCTNKKDLYAAYTEVTAYLYERTANCTLVEHSEIIMQFVNVVEKMVWAIDNKTKDLEKAFKEAKTPEEKLNLFLQ